MNRHEVPRQVVVCGYACGLVLRRFTGRCGDFIDPKDWCAGCKAAKGPCRAPHRRDRKRADAVFCDAACRSAYRQSFIRDCL